MQNFVKIKLWRYGEITLSFTDIGPLSRIFSVANMSFNAIRENKILAEFSEFEVCLSSHVASADVRVKAVILLLLIHCLVCARFFVLCPCLVM